MTKKIKVLLNQQKLIAYNNGQEVFTFDCVSGDKDHPTDIGVFPIFQKDRKHFSHKYKVEMDFAMFFTHDGKAIHKSHLVGPISMLKYMGMDSFGSHGCVRLSGEDAEKLFDWTPLHTLVEVVNG